MSKYLLVPTEELEEIVEKEAIPYKDYARETTETSMALELLEYRKIYGPLGCAWLAKK